MNLKAVQDMEGMRQVVRPGVLTTCADKEQIQIIRVFNITRLLAYTVDPELKDIIGVLPIEAMAFKAGAKYVGSTKLAGVHLRVHTHTLPTPTPALPPTRT